MNLNQVTIPVLDVTEAVEFYRLLGFEQLVGTIDYARFSCPQGDATFSIHLSRTALHSSGVVLYFECEQLDEQVAVLQDRGIVFTKLPTDERWLWREARLTDPSGNVLCLYYAGSNRKNPPWRLPAK